MENLGENRGKKTVIPCISKYRLEELFFYKKFPNQFPQSSDNWYYALPLDFE